MRGILNRCRGRESKICRAKADR